MERAACVAVKGLIRLLGVPDTYGLAVVRHQPAEPHGFKASRIISSFLKRLTARLP